MSGFSGGASGGGFTNATITPQGRLTLQTLTPCMTTTQSAKTTIFYTPYVGNLIPLYDGSSMVPTPFSELSIATTDTAKNPAAIGGSMVNDWFVWTDGGTIRLSHGPDWTNETTRSAGTDLVMVNGIYLNNASITNGPAASRGTYLGTTRSSSASQLNWIFGGTSAGGTAGLFGVWNAYNRCHFTTSVLDTTASWTYAVNDVWRPPNGSVAMRVSFVRGLDDSPVTAQYNAVGQAGAGATAISGVGLDSTTAYSGTTSSTVAAAVISMISEFNGLPGIGYHFITALEYNDTTTASTWRGLVAGTTPIQSGLHVRLEQ